MDPNTARQVLRLFPDAPLSPAMVESAFARESWERHPSRYPDEAGRASAVAWAATLTQARAVLLQSMTSPDAAPWTPPTAGPPPTAGGSVPIRSAVHAGGAVAPAGDSGPAAGARSGRRRRIGLVAGIVAASAGVIALVVGAGFGATRLAEQFVDQVSVLAEQPEWTGETVRYSSDETLFTFPAAIEEYSDGRYWAECPEEFAGACWQMAVITEASCTSLEVDLAFTDDESAWTGDHQEIFALADVVAGGVTPVVFGHHEYDWAWIADVRCLDGGTAASRDSIAANTPLARLEAGRWEAEGTGFRFRTSLETYDDGRLDAWCPPGFDRGCWQAVLIPEKSCGSLEIRYSLGNGDEAEMTETTWRPTGVVAGEPVEVVFGHDDYEHGWISHVVCIS